VIYFDNAATSWPKPPAVLEAMQRFLIETGSNPGRSGHRLSIEAGRVVYRARESIARLFGHDDPLSVVFTKNATEALNLAIVGLLESDDHVVTSTMEHNSVLRPLRYLEQRGVEVTRVSCGADGSLDPAAIEQALTPKTKLIILTHASNVSGTLAPIEAVGLIAEQRDLVFCVDAAQTAGAYAIDMRAMHIDLLAFTGHKSLFGPQGTGGLCIGARARGRVTPLIRGGTGSRSDSDQQPDFLPDRYESGTLNAVGLAGLAAGVAFVESIGVQAIGKKESLITRRFINGLKTIPGITRYGPTQSDRHVAVVSINLKGLSCAELAVELEERAEICCRAGLHCAPMAHRQLGTFPHGTTRFSFGFFNTEEEIDAALAVLRKLARQTKGDGK
jgi:cysteine desulfurase family protein